MEGCALCGKRARMYCESDQAKLCWDCDDKVHGANFLVAKHTRVLLCRLCQSSTPWKACGPKLTPTDSLCHPCANTDSHKEEEEDDRDRDRDRDRDCEDDDDGDYGSDVDSDFDLGYDDDSEEDQDEEEGENQVVPWSSASASASSPPLPLASSASAGAGLSWKRVRGNSFVDSDDEIDCASSEMPSASQLPEDDSSSWSIFRPWKQPGTTQRSQSSLVEDDAR